MRSPSTAGSAGSTSTATARDYVCRQFSVLTWTRAIRVRGRRLAAAPRGRGGARQAAHSTRSVHADMLDTVIVACASVLSDDHQIRMATMATLTVRSRSSVRVTSHSAQPCGLRDRQRSRAKGCSESTASTPVDRHPYIPSRAAAESPPLTRRRSVSRATAVCPTPVRRLDGYRRIDGPRDRRNSR